MFYLIIRTLALILSKLLFRVQAFGQCNIPLKGGFILASNHTSYLDPPILAVTCPRVLSFIAKEELFKNAIFGPFITAMNAFPLKTETADLKALRWAIGALKAGGVVTIFPEGGRTTDGELAEPLKGVGFIAAKANVPIIPAFIEGSNKAFPVNSKFIRPKKIKVYFGQAIKLEEFNLQAEDSDLYQRIAQRTMEKIRKLRERGD